MIRRTAGRVVFTDREGRVLLMRGTDPGDPGRGGFWFTPGGALEPGESLEEGTRREIREELGIELGRLGPVVMTRRVRFPIDGTWYEQSESLFHVATDVAFVPDPADLTGLELTTVEEFRWVAAGDLERLGEPVHPAGLADLLDHLARLGPPDPPWDDDQVSPDGGV